MVIQISLEEIDRDMYRAPAGYLWKPKRARGVFGGQVIGQALMAANKTVDQSLSVHSLHSYFILAGDSECSIVYKVARLFDGRSFSKRSVLALQKGKTIAIVIASFQIAQPGIQFQSGKMPSCPLPHLLPALSIEEVSQMDNEKGFLTVDVRLCPNQNNETSKMWIKLVDQALNDDQIHMGLAAYLTDFRLLGESASLLVKNKAQKRMIVSLDHNMWFHCPFRVDEWLLFEVGPLRATGGRLLCEGRVWRQDGQLAISVRQEGLFRLAPPPALSDTSSRL